MRQDAVAAEMSFGDCIVLMQAYDCNRWIQLVRLFVYLSRLS
jgi:hypothetical protein